ncbi:MAG: VWA domain-containing protein [Streptosporangiaceae bacterium]
MLGALVAELRAVGIPVSVGEHLDAAGALSAIPLSDKEVLRIALQAALIKNPEHLSTFSLIFELHTAGTPESGRGPLAGLSGEDLRAALRQAIAADDGLALAQLADEYVRRFAGAQPGERVAGVMYTRAVTAAADLEGLRAELLGDGPAGGGPGGGAGGGAGDPGDGDPGDPAGSGLASVRARLARAGVDQGVGRFRAEIQAAVRRLLVADRGAAAVRATMRVRLPEDTDIGTASTAELEAMTTAIAPLARQLTRVLASQPAYRRRRLSIRATLRRSMSSGGVPFRIMTEPARPPRPEIVVLCDVSGSVSAFSRFTLDLLIALDSRLRVFAFVDGLAEITSLVSDARAAGRRLDQRQVTRQAVRFSGSSDYGWVLREFAERHARQLTRRSVVLVVGDARTNYLDPAAEALAEIQRRAGEVYWLNPEPRRTWDSGDSVISRYAPFCGRVEECRSLRQIADFVRSLAAAAGA